MNKLYRDLKSALTLGLILALASPGLAQAPALARIGVAGGVRGTVKAFPPGEKPVGRILSSGQDLYLNDKVTTGPEGSLQVMLLDETVFTIGPNSSLVLDEFIYDPESHSGKVTARVAKGIFRFVTGQIGHKKPSNMKVKFPIGTIGIRGTIVAGQVGESGTTAVLLGPGPAKNAAEERVGAFRMENAGVSVDVVKPGYGVHVDGPGEPPSLPALVSQIQLSAILGALSPEKPEKPGGPRNGAEAAADRRASAADDSGQSTAQAQGDLSNTQDVADLAGDMDAAAQTGSNEIDLDALIASNQASWDEVRSVTNGTGYYSGAGNFVLSQCVPGPCAGANGTTSLYLDIDFGKRTVGSALSKVQVTSNDAGQGVPINDTVNFSAQSFAALAGAAALSGTSGSGTTATVSLLNIGGVAGAAGASAKYNAGGVVGSGSALASLTCASGSCH